MTAPPTRPQTERRRRNPGTPLGRPRRDRSVIEKTPKPTAQPTYNSAADAAAAVQSDGYKPREERGWEEFHPDLDLEQQLVMFTADEVDGVTAEERRKQDQASEAAGQEDGLEDGQGPASMNGMLQQDNEMSFTTPSNKRRPGRPHRRPEAMLNGLGLVSPPAPKIIPLPTQNPKERLSLAKPSYRLVKTFDTFEADKNVQDNYVTQSMKNVGYQESDKFERPRHLIRLEEDALEDDIEDGLRLEADNYLVAAAASNGLSKVEYDMDEQDGQWLDAYNQYRKEHEVVDAIKPAIFEITMTQIEKEWHALEKSMYIFTFHDVLVLMSCRDT
jgi:NuA3 HAT complex component NTO1